MNATSPTGNDSVARAWVHECRDTAQKEVRMQCTGGRKKEAPREATDGRAVAGGQSTLLGVELHR
jgi:hypothetical protein